MTWDDVVNMPTDRRRRYISFMNDIINERNENYRKQVEEAKANSKTPKVKDNVVPPHVQKTIGK